VAIAAPNRPESPAVERPEHSISLRILRQDAEANREAAREIAALARSLRTESRILAEEARARRDAGRPTVPADGPTD
jgi:hypothetical protein